MGGQGTTDVVPFAGLGGADRRAVPKLCLNLAFQINNVEDSRIVVAPTLYFRPNYDVQKEVGYSRRVPKCGPCPVNM